MCNVLSIVYLNRLADEQQVKDKDDEFAIYCCTHPTESIHSTEVNAVI